MVDSKFIAISAGLLIQAGGVIWWASGLSSRVSQNNFQIQLLFKDVEKAMEFVELWPAGKYGSGELPSDTRQDLKIANLEKQVDKITSKLYNGH